MIIMIMINREDELRVLNDVYSSKKAELVLLYGRRRVGKSRLLTESIKDRKDAQYFLCDMSDNILDILARQVSDQFVRFESWEDFFEFVEKGPSKIIIIDEFQYLYNIDNAWPTILQRWWERIKKTDKKIILSGSILSTIYKISTGYGSALYGRRTRDVHLQPLKFGDVCRFLKGLDMESCILAYSILGGVPRYLEEFQTDVDIKTNIRCKILDKSTFLHNEPMNLMFEEFNDPAPYISIISAILGGHRTFKAISDRSHITVNALPKYLTILERIGIIDRDIPVTEKAVKSRKTQYRVSDNFYGFWFYFIFPKRYQFELGLADEVLDEIESGLNLFVSERFERICQQAVLDLGLIKPVRIGRQWGTIPKAPKGKNTYELDIMAVDEKNKTILFGECKWSKGVDAKTELELLKKKSEHVFLKKKKAEIKYVLFARSFKRKIDGVCYDLKDLERICE